MPAEVAENRTIYKVYPENGTCWVSPETPWLDEYYQYDCQYWYDWEGVSIVTIRTIYGYQPTVYASLMAVTGILMVILTFLAVYLVSRNENLMRPPKLFLCGGLLISLARGVQMIYNFQCLISWTGMPEINLKGQPATGRFNCLSTVDYPMCGLIVNQIISTYALSTLLCYRTLIYAFVINRFLAVHFGGRYYLMFGRAVEVQVLLCVLVPSIPYFANVTTTNGDLYMAKQGFYFHPLTYVVREYWMKAVFLFQLAPLFLKLSIFMDCVALYGQLSTYRKMRSMRGGNALKRFTDLNLQKEIFAIHLCLLIAWLFEVIFSTFLFPPRSNYHLATFGAFFVEYMPGWIIGIAASSVIIFFNRHGRRNRTIGPETDEQTQKPTDLTGEQRKVFDRRAA